MLCVVRISTYDVCIDVYCCWQQVGIYDDEARPKERSDRSRFLPLGQKASSYRGAYRVPLFKTCEPGY